MKKWVAATARSTILSSMPAKRRFVVATPFRTVCDDNARALEESGALRLLALGTRRGTAGVPGERTRLLPAFGLLSYAAARLFSTTRAESFRFAMHPWFDRGCASSSGPEIISSPLTAT